MKRLLLLCSLSSLVLLVPRASLAALSCQFAWDAPTQGTPLGYRLYPSLVSGNYTGSTPVQAGTVLTFTTPCARGQYWIVRAFDAVGESGNSNEVQIPALGEPKALRITLTIEVP